MTMAKFEWRHIDAWIPPDDNWKETEAFDAWSAAKIGADSWNQEEQSMIRSRKPEIFEVKDFTGHITKWSVLWTGYGEVPPYYYAIALS